MPQIRGKNAKKTSSDSKRHFTVIMGNKEHGLYVSSTPSSAARKAVTKLCTSNKSKKVEFHIREITQGSKKKTYGPYVGYIEKLKEPIKLKGRIIKYKPIAKLSKNSGVKKGGMYRTFGGGPAIAEVKKCIHDRNSEKEIDTTALRTTPSEEEKWLRDASGKKVLLEKKEEVEKLEEEFDPKSRETYFLVKKNNGMSGWVRGRYIKCPPKVKVMLPNININNSSPSENNWSSSFQPRYSATTSELRGQPASLSGLRRQPTYNQGPFASLSGLQRQPTYNQGQPASLSGLRRQPTYNQGPFASLSGLQRQPTYNQGPFASLSANISQPITQVFQKLYNCLDNAQLLESIGGFNIPGISIPKGQVIDFLEKQKDSRTGNEFGKIRVSTSKGDVEGFVLFENLKKTRWCCNHDLCLKFNGPYDKDQSTNKDIPVTVAIILRNDQGDILVGTETDDRKTSEFNKALRGYHLCAGKIDPGSCPIISSYDETAEESRFLQVERHGNRDFKSWDAIFKPNKTFRMEPWVSSGRAIVFVGDIGNTFFDASNPPHGSPQQFRQPKELDYVFDQLRRVLPRTLENHKYKEKINFEWVTPLPKGSSDSDWQAWSRRFQMFGWGRSIIQDYVEHSAQLAQLQPRLQNFSRGMSAQKHIPTYGASSASSAYAPQNLPDTDDFLYDKVVKKARGRRIEKVSDNKYIIHNSDTHRIIIERELSDNGIPGFITETPETGPLVLTEEYYDNEIERLIDNRLRTSQIYLTELLELCSDIYNNMFKITIPREKLENIKRSIMQSYTHKKNSGDILFYKQ